MEPYFSLIVPTKGRESLIHKTISSILIQSFEDYELLLIDNNENDLTQQVITEYNDSRIRYIKTGGLSMPDNWNIAYNNAKGQYFILITDRMYFSDNYVLQHIQNITNKNKNKIITWQWKNEGISDKNTLKWNAEIEIDEIQSSKILNGFFYGGKERQWFNLRSPKGLNTCLPRLVYLKIKKKYGRLCFSLAPDFSMAFILLVEEKSILHINEQLIISGGLNQSNGKLSLSNKEKFLEYVNSTGLTIEDTFMNVPVPIFGVLNSTYNDFFTLSKRFGWGYTWECVNIKEYLTLLFGELIKNKKNNERKFDFEIWKASVILLDFKEIIDVIRKCHVQGGSITYKMKAQIFLSLIKKKCN